MVDEDSIDPEADIEALDTPAVQSKDMQSFLTPDGGETSVEIKTPPLPVPVFHDTPIENQIDDDLMQVNVALRNVTRSYKACRTVQDVVAIARTHSQLLRERRVLSNKKLGHKDQGEAPKTIYHIPD